MLQKYAPGFFRGHKALVQQALRDSVAVQKEAVEKERQRKEAEASGTGSGGDAMSKGGARGAANVDARNLKEIQEQKQVEAEKVRVCVD